MLRNVKNTHASIQIQSLIWNLIFVGLNMVTKRPQRKRWRYQCKVLIHPGHEMCKMKADRPDSHSLQLTDRDLTHTGKCSPLDEKTFDHVKNFRRLCHIRASPRQACKHSFSLNLAARLSWYRFCSGHFHPFKTFFLLCIWTFTVTGPDVNT
jgi:hypothetical protein